MRKEEYSDNRHFHFHYDQEERQKYLSDRIRERTTGKPGLFKRNRSLLVILIDILIILLIIVVVIPFIGREDNVARNNGYTFTFGGFVFEDKSLFNVKITNSAKEESGENKTKTVAITFSVGGTERTVTVTDILPGPGKERIVRGTIPYDGTDREAQAVVRYQGEEFVLVTKLSS